MKGVTMIADLFSLFVLLASILLMTLLVWSFIVLFHIEDVLGVTTPRKVELVLFTYPIKYDSMMMAFLELQYENIPMKRIINAAAIQNRIDPWLDGQRINGWDDAAYSFFTTRINSPFMLRLQSPNGEVKIIDELSFQGDELPTSLQKTSIEFFMLDGEASYLELFVSE